LYADDPLSAVNRAWLIAHREDVTGPDDATKGIVVIYDIFGYFDQTIQGADILATSSDQKYKVVIPDWYVALPAAELRCTWLPLEAPRFPSTH
jgi:hypothetical protein